MTDLTSTGKKIPEKIQKIIINFGSCVLGIYLIEGLVREDLFSLCEAMSSKINGFVAIWIYVLIVVLLCWLIVAAVRFLIGFVKKLTRQAI